MSTEIEWRWAESDGTTHPAAESELRRLLESGQLPPYVLVWRPSWGGWLPARNVQELSSSLGKDAKAPTPPIQMPGLGQPPRPPLSKYKLAGHPANRPILSPAETRPRRSVPPPPPSARRARPPPPPPPSSSAPSVSSPSTPPPPSVPPPPKGPIHIRDVMPTLAEEAPVDRRTLKPSRAVAPPPRMPPRSEATPLPSFAELEASGELDLEERAAPEEPVASTPDDGATTAPSNPFETTLQSHQATELPSPAANATAAVPDPAEAPPGAGPGESTSRADATPSSAASPGPTTAGLARPAGPGSSAAAAPRRPTGAPIPAGAIRTATVVGLSVPIVALLTYLFRSEPRQETAPPAGSVALAPSVTERAVPTVASPPIQEAAMPPPVAPAPAAAKGCHIQKAAHRLASSAHLGVPPLGAAAPNGRLALGFAASPNEAVGLTVDMASSQVEQVFSRTTKNPLIGVVPGIADGKLLFWVDATGGPLLGLRTIPGEPAFAVGLSEGRFVRRSPRGTTPIWDELPPGDALSTPRVASHGDRHAVVTRLGGKGGAIATGFLARDGSPIGPARTVRTSDAELGTPTIALNDTEGLVSFAGRPSSDAPWAVRLGVLKPDPSPVQARPFEPPPGGPGGPAISPAAHALPDGRFLLAWTEGSSGNRDVRAQVLDNDLVPAGQPVTLSPSGSNAGQGVPLALGNAALVVYYVQTDTGQELWGAILRCD